MLTSEQTPPEPVIAQETGAGLFQTRIHSGDHCFLMDEPVELGGLATGPGPFDLLRAALGACTLMTMKLYAKRKGWVLDRLRVEVMHCPGALGERDRFDRTLHLGDVTEEQHEGLVKIAERCRVHLLLDKGADVTVTVAESI